MTLDHMSKFNSDHAKRLTEYDLTVVVLPNTFD